MKIHIGCGKRDFGKEWHHIDGSNYSHVNSHNITVLPFEDNTVDLIYASHTLEYFDREEVIQVLSEWKRCLKPNGMLRLAVPDFKAMTMLYNKGDINLESCLGPLYGKWKMDNTTTIYHKTVYDFDNLKNVLTEVGFKDIRLWDWKNTCHSDVDDYSQAYIPHMEKQTGVLISLNVESNK